MKFNYQARTKEGKIQTGQIEAFSKEAAITILQKYGLYPTFIEEAKRPSYFKRIAFLEKIDVKDLVIATRELAIMFRSGVPFIEALNTIAQESKNSQMREIFLEISKEVKAGSPLSAALSRYPGVFSPFYISMVKIGEVSGELPKTLEILAEYIERQYHFTSKIKSALLYPLILVITALIVIILVIFLVGPKIAEFATTIGANLPLPIQIFLAIGNFLKAWGIPLFVFLSGGVVALIFYFKTPEGKEELGELALQLPFFGPFLKTVYLSRLGETLSTLISAGVPISQALEISSEVVSQRIYQEAIISIKEAVQGGESFSNALKKYSTIFPPFFCQMAATGEKSGNLSSSLLSISNFYEKEVGRKIETFATILEPILIVFIGLIVGLLIVTVLTTIYKTITFI